MDYKSLDEAIVDFNDWTGTARLYYNKETGEFSCSVYTDDVARVGTFSTDEYVAILMKEERNGNMRIGERRREYIIDFVKLLSEGWKAFQIDGLLVDKYPFIY